MSRRAEGDDLDSLNLLLDTVCNMFGIFIFSSLVVALMAMSRTAQMTTETGQDGARAETEQRILVTQESIRRLADQLESRRGGRRAVIEERARAASDRLTRAESELLARQAALAGYKDQTRDAKEGVKQLKAALPSLREELQALRAQLERERQLKEVDVRTPMRRSLEGRVPVQVVLHEGRVFVINAWASLPPETHPCDAWCTWNPKDVVERASTCDSDCIRGGPVNVARRVQLRDGGGIPAESAEELARNPEWGAFITAMERGRDRFVVSIYSTPTGFRAFGPVRGEIVSRGIPYNTDTTVLEPGRFYVDRIQTGTPIGQ